MNDFDQDSLVSKLKDACSNARVVGLFAFLCGSRAWGLSDARSDFDLRLLFWPEDEDDESVETFTVNFSLAEHRFELVGWDLRKAVRLHQSSNATLAEWLRSKCVFGIDATLLRSWQAAVGSAMHGSFVPHYCGLLKSEKKKNLGGREIVLAEYLHAARPALFIHWLLEKRSFPPANFSELLAAPGVPEPVRKYLSELAERKRSGNLRKGEDGPHSRVVDEWFDALEKLGSGVRAEPHSKAHIALLRNLLGRSRIASQPPAREVRVACVHLSDYRDSVGRSYGELMFELLAKANNPSKTGIRLRGPIEFNAASSVELPSHGDFDLLLLPGSPLAVYDDLPCVVKMEKWLRDILKRNDHAPIFGICFGHQMIGKCLGGIVEKNPLGVEKGCREIELFGEWKERATVLRLIQSHQDAVLQLPPGARLLAKNDKGIQAMAIGSKIISLQGHPECGVEQGWDFLDREGLDADLVAFAQQSLREHGGGDSDLIATMVAEQIFSNFK